jgi:hypothetical protein
MGVTELLIKELTIEELAERWDWLCWECGVYLRIIEQFPQRGVNSFIVNGLTMDFEQEFIMCHDIDEKIYDNLSILMIFIRESLIQISLLPIGNDLYQERLIFKDRTILIEIV